MFDVYRNKALSHAGGGEGALSYEHTLCNMGVANLYMLWISLNTRIIANVMMMLFT